MKSDITPRTHCKILILHEFIVYVLRIVLLAQIK